MKEEKKNNGQNGHRGEDPQPNHGNDGKGHQGGGVVIKPGKNHALKLTQ